MIRGVARSAQARLAISLVIGVVVVLLVGLLSSPLLGVLSGIAGMGAVFVLIGLVVLWPMTPDSTQRHARREDYRPHVEELLVAAAALGAWWDLSYCWCSATPVPGTLQPRSV